MAGKSLDELRLSDVPLSREDQEDQADRAEAVEAFLQEILDLQSNPRAQFAVDTTNGIYDSVKKTGRISEGQRRAIHNITASLDRSNQRTGSRRYEGWGR